MRWVLAVFAAFFTLLALGASIVIPFLVLNKTESSLRFPLLALSGFLGIFACLALLILAFKAMDLVSENQALGMPEGSIRALIAVILIVILGIVALSLLNSQKSGLSTASETKIPSALQPSQAQQQTDNEATTMRSVPSSAFRWAAVEESPGPTTNPTPPSGAGPNAAGTNPDGGDLPKQLVTLLGGLVTTIIGFYFGSQTANSAASRGANSATSAATEAIKAMKP